MHRLVRSKWSLKYAAIVIAFCTPVRTTKLNSRPAGQPIRPHITGIDYVRVYVSNIDKSRKFYSNVLGLTNGCPHYTSGEICFLVRPSAQRLLLQRARASRLNWPAGRRRSYGPSPLELMAAAGEWSCTPRHVPGPWRSARERRAAIPLYLLEGIRPAHSPRPHKR